MTAPKRTASGAAKGASSADAPASAGTANAPAPASTAPATGVSAATGPGTSTNAPAGSAAGTPASATLVKKKRGDVAVLLDFAGERRWLTYLGCVLSAVSMLLSFGPFVCIWLVARDLMAVAPNWSQAGASLAAWGWAAFWFALASTLVYFAALMCTHLAAFRTAANMRKRCLDHLMHVSLGYFDMHASGSLRRVIDGCAAATEGLLAHKVPDTVGSIAMLLGMLVVLFVFDWRMGLACVLAVVVSLGAMGLMMGGQSKNFMMRHQQALVNMSKAGTEYVRGIPVVKVFQQTVYSFKAFHDAIVEYSEMAENYTVKVCRGPQVFQLCVINGVAIFLVPVVLLLAPGATDFGAFLTDVAFYAVFSGIIATAMTRMMFVMEEMQIAGDAVMRVGEVLAAPVMPAPASPKTPSDASVRFEHVGFTYEGAGEPALSDVSFEIPAGSTVALVGPSGGGKTTCASLVPRFWDADEGRVLVGGVDVRELDPAVLMDRVAFVFQNSRLLKCSIADNVAAARPRASRADVLAALRDAQCDDILEKLPQGADAIVGAQGTHLSGGEQQRIALARALLKDAPIVVLDEATAFADPENEALIQKAFARLADGRTVLMIAHRLSTVVGADLIVVLDGGRVVEQGTHAELLAAGGTYARMWEDYQRSVTWRITSGGPGHRTGGSEDTGCGESTGHDGRDVRGCAGSARRAEIPCPAPSNGGEA